MTPDVGGAVTTGVGWNQLSIKGHRRDDAATAYLGALEGVAVDLLVDTRVLGLAVEAGGAPASGSPEASCGPKVRSCSAPVPSTLRAC